MEQPPNYSLFFLKENSFFDEGTLFELEDNVVSAASLDPTSDSHSIRYRMTITKRSVIGFPIAATAFRVLLEKTM